LTEKTSRRYVPAIFILAFAIRIAYAVVAPPFQAPDEYSHFSYAKFVHDAHRLPVQQSHALRPEELEFHQPPLYYMMAASLIPSTSLVDARPLLPLRLMNILFSMLTVVIAYYFAARILKWNPFSVALVCAVFALLPTYSYLSATMRNGTLATFFASLGFYLCAKAVLEEEQQREARWAWIGVVAGLAILSKLSTIGFVFATVVTVVGTSPSLRVSVRRAGWFGLGVMSTAGWWFARNLFIYGQPFAIVENGYDFTPSPMDWVHTKHSAIIIFKTFWAVFGRINEHYFPDIYRFYWWFAGLAVLGLIRYALRKRRDLGDLPNELVGFFVVAIGMSFVTTMYYAHNYNSDQGRYMFPVLIPITTFIAIGLNALVPPRYQRWVLDTVVFAFAGINTLVLARLAAVYWQIG
jgi:hypothetical protein